MNRVMSVSVDFPDKEFEMIELTGAWSRERSVKIKESLSTVRSLSIV